MLTIQSHSLPTRRWDRETVWLGLLLGTVATVRLLVTYGVLFVVDAECQALPDCAWGNWGMVGLSATLVLAMTITLFGVLALPGGRDEQGLRERSNSARAPMT